MANQNIQQIPRARRTQVAQKMGMAVTGIIFVLFVLFHMYGNLKAFAGQEAYDHYAEYLREFMYPILPKMGLLWIMRVALTGSVLYHVWAAAKLWKSAKHARGSAYAKTTRLAQTYASRTMRWGGIILLLFIIFHVLHFTTLHAPLGYDSSAYDSPYMRMVQSFSHWYVWAIYLVALGALAMHIRHGVWSALATLGLSKKRRELIINGVAYAVAGAIFVGFMLPPTLMLMGVIK